MASIKSRVAHALAHFAPVLGSILTMTFAAAADAPPVSTPGAPPACSDCGVVHSIRRMDKTLTRDRKPLPSLADAPDAGGLGNTIKTVPLVRIDKDGAKRVPPQAASLKSWEVTVRYEGGGFDSVTLDSEPQFKIGDRVRLRENILEPLKEPAR